MGDAIVVVSGLPRSGTSMIMKMLEAGGFPVVSDDKRKPDPDNPKGYYEYEKVKRIQQDASFISQLHGKALKIISFVLYYLPAIHSYKIIFIKRNMQEILSSQRKMLKRLKKPTDGVDDDIMAGKFNIHLKKIFVWIDRQKNIDCLFLNYHDVMHDPLSNAKALTQFLKVDLEINAMAGVVDKSLYRNRCRTPIQR